MVAGGGLDINVHFPVDFEVRICHSYWKTRVHVSLKETR